MSEPSDDIDVESLVARLELALDAGAVAEWSVRADSGRWLLATRLDAVFGDGMPVDAEAADEDARRHRGDGTPPGSGPEPEPTGCPLADASFARRLDRQGRQALAEAYRELLGGADGMRVEVRIFRTDGTPRQVRIDGLLTAGSGASPPRASGFVRDVTEQRRLGEINDFLSRLAVPLADIGDVDDTLQRIAADVVPFLADRCLIEFVMADGSLLRAADSHRPPEVTQPLPAELPATRVPEAPLIERIVSERRTLVLNDLDAIDIRGLSSTEAHRAELADYRPCDYLGAPLVAGDRCFGVLGILTQLDEKRRFLEHEIALVERLAERVSAALDNARLYASLRESDRRKDVFLATLSHELRNPVGAVANGIEALRDSIVDPEDRATLAAIDRQMGSLSHMLDDLLDLARINEDKLALQLGAVSLGTLLDDVLTALRPAFVTRRQQLESSLPVPDIVLRADATRLEQIVVNLLLNAGRHTPDGGRITLSAWRDGAVARIEVGDDGVGLDAEQRARVFDYFVQFVDVDAPPSSGGLGIGLGLVRRLVALHGGTIEVESEGRGRGATFRVSLPIVMAPAAPFPRDAAPAPVVTGASDTSARSVDADAALRILLVEDNVDAANALVRVLERLGHTVHAVHDGEAAVREFARRPRPLVLLDIGLPDMDGHAVAARLRESPGGRACTLVALTGYGQPADRQRAEASGFDDYLVKPLKLAALRAIVARATRPAPA